MSLPKPINRNTLIGKIYYGTLFVRGLVVYTLGMAYLILVQGPQLPITPFLSARVHNWQARGFGLWSLFLLKYISGLSCKVMGREHMPPHGQPCVVIGNHQSAWETVFFTSYQRPLVSVLKQELFWLPVYGMTAWLHGHVFINRDYKRAALRRVSDQGVDRLKQGLSVLVFPEGTRVSADGVGRFALGAAHMAISAGVPVLPAAHNAGLFWPRMKIAKLPGAIHLRYGKPISSEGKTAAELTEEVRSSILSMLRELPGMQEAAHK